MLARRRLRRAERIDATVDYARASYDDSSNLDISGWNVGVGLAFLLGGR